MQTLSEAIQFITDDEEAKAFLASHNQLQDMIPQEPFDHVSVVFGTDEAYCLATFDTGHANANDNGYTVMVIPRDALPIDQVAALFEECRQAARLFPEGRHMEYCYVNEPAYN